MCRHHWFDYQPAQTGLQVLIETKEVTIGKLQARNSGYATIDSKEAIGFAKKGYVYLKNGTALQSVVTYYRRQYMQLKNPGRS